MIRGILNSWQSNCLWFYYFSINFRLPVNKHLCDWGSADWPIASKCITNIDIAVEILRVTGVGSIITFIDGDVNPNTFGMWLKEKPLYCTWKTQTLKEMFLQISFYVNISTCFMMCIFKTYRWQAIFSIIQQCVLFLYIYLQCVQMLFQYLCTCTSIKHNTSFAFLFYNKFFQLLTT